MATRDLTRQFIDLRKIKSFNNLSLGVERGSEDFHSDNGLLDDNNNHFSSSKDNTWKTIREQLPPAWVDVVDDIEDCIEKITKKMKVLTNLHTKRLMVTFDSDESKHEREIDLMTKNITELFRKAEGSLKRLSKQDQLTSKMSGAEHTVRQNIQHSHARKLQNLSMTFRQMQREYLGRVKNQKSGNNDGFDFLAEENKAKTVENLMEEGFTAEQMQALEMTEQLVDENDKEIEQIIRSITELSDIFKELAVLVIDQGTILDRIDYNMEQVVDHTEQGIKQLVKAEEYQKSAMPVKCIVALLVFIFIMLLVLIFKHTGKNK